MKRDSPPLLGRWQTRQAMTRRANRLARLQALERQLVARGLVLPKAEKK